jgi:hypothetical protein
VVAYASRSLSKAERNYSAHKLEFLALKWAVTEKCYDHLCDETRRKNVICLMYTFIYSFYFADYTSSANKA